MSGRPCKWLARYLHRRCGAAHLIWCSAVTCADGGPGTGRARRLVAPRVHHSGLARYKNVPVVCRGLLLQCLRARCGAACPDSGCAGPSASRRRRSAPARLRRCLHTGARPRVQRPHVSCTAQAAIILCACWRGVAWAVSCARAHAPTLSLRRKGGKFTHRAAPPPGAGARPARIPQRAPAAPWPWLPAGVLATRNGRRQGCCCARGRALAWPAPPIAAQPSGHRTHAPAACGAAPRAAPARIFACARPRGVPSRCRGTRGAARARGPGRGAAACPKKVGAAARPKMRPRRARARTHGGPPGKIGAAGGLAHVPGQLPPQKSRRRAREIRPRRAGARHGERAILGGGGAARGGRHGAPHARARPPRALPTQAGVRARRARAGAARHAQDCARGSARRARRRAGKKTRERCHRAAACSAPRAARANRRGCSVVPPS